MNEPTQTETTEAIENQSGSAGFEVAGEPGVWWCARHKNTKTRLRCGRCEKPICPKCTTYGPTGARCRDCVSYRGTHLYQASAKQLAITFAAAFALGLVGAIAISSTGLFLLVLFAPALGGILGPLLTRITGAKRGPVVAGVAAAGVGLGILAVGAPRVVSLLQMGASLSMAFGFSGLMLLAFLILAVAGVWLWLK